MQIFDEIRLWLVVLVLLFGCQTLLMSLLMRCLVRMNERNRELEEKLVKQEEEKNV